MKININRLKTIDTLNLYKKKVMVRVDLNLPISSSGDISDYSKIKQIIPTIKLLTDRNAQILLMSHLGRPSGFNNKLSFKLIVHQLEKIFHRKIIINQDYLSNKFLNYDNNQMVLFDNLRFHPGEEKNDLSFAKFLSKFGDYYINDAFAVSHRIHSSTVGITNFLPSYAGPALVNEIKDLISIIDCPKKPVLLIIGGRKADDKISTLFSLMEKTNEIFIGGVLANSFLKSLNYEMGFSLVNTQISNICQKILKKSKKMNIRIYLPDDFYVLHNKKIKIVKSDCIKSDMTIMDIGPLTIKKIKRHIALAATIYWNGPMGKYEDDRFNGGNKEIYKAIKLSKAHSLIGGGDTLASINSVYKTSSNNVIVSTGGGALFEFIKREGLLPAFIPLNGN